MAEFRKDSLSEFLRPGTVPAKGDFRQTAPAARSEEAAAPVTSGLNTDVWGFPRRPPAAAGPDELMAHLRARGPMTAAALLEAVGLALGPGLEALDRLERYGLVMRETRDGAVVLRAAD